MTPPTKTTIAWKTGEPLVTGWRTVLQEGFQREIVGRAYFGTYGQWYDNDEENFTLSNVLAWADDTCITHEGEK